MDFLKIIEITIAFSWIASLFVMPSYFAFVDMENREFVKNNKVKIEKLKKFSIFTPLLFIVGVFIEGALNDFFRINFKYSIHENAYLYGFGGFLLLSFWAICPQLFMIFAFNKTFLKFEDGTAKIGFLTLLLFPFYIVAKCVRFSTYNVYHLLRYASFSKIKM